MIQILLWPLTFLRLLLQSIGLALGQIWANKMRSILTTIGIVIGIASVTAVIAAMTGLKAKILDDMSTFGTNNIYILSRAPETGPLKDKWDLVRFKPEHLEGLLEHCPSIARYTRMCDYLRTVRFGDEAVDGVEVTGIDNTWHLIEDRQIELGRPFSLMDQEHARQVCLITVNVRDKLRLNRDCVGDTIVVGNRSFHIVGVVSDRVEAGIFGGQGERDQIFIPFATAWKLQRPWIWCVASTHSPELSDEAQAELRFFLRRTRQIAPGEPDTFRLEVVQKAIEQFNSIYGVMTAVAGGIVGISLLVGGVGIMNIMLVSVSERTREIGLRKAIGARPSAILLQFLVEAVVLCAFGGMIGVVCGQMLTVMVANIPNAEFLSQARIPLWAIGLSFGFSSLVGICFGMFPATKAARLNPIEALRHE